MSKAPPCGIASQTHFQEHTATSASWVKHIVQPSIDALQAFLAPVHVVPQAHSAVGARRDRQRAPHRHVHTRHRAGMQRRQHLGKVVFILLRKS